MPLIRGQILDSTFINIVGSNGASITITRDEVMAYANTHNRAQTLSFFKAQIEAAIGVSLLPVGRINWDYDQATQTLTLLELT